MYLVTEKPSRTKRQKSWKVHSIFVVQTIAYDGCGLGPDFSKALHSRHHVLFQDFGKENVMRGTHLENAAARIFGRGGGRFWPEALMSVAGERDLKLAPTPRPAARPLRAPASRARV